MCLAPWVHTYLSPQTERRMCCASREPAQNFEQYIDTAAGTGRYIPVTLEQHWNSDHMRSVRRRMMAGETLPECEVCNDQLLNTNVYRTYFDHLFQHKLEEVYNNTMPDGTTTMEPVSWDYRFSNLCNFKCRTCGDMLSSAWESEQKQAQREKMLGRKKDPQEIIKRSEKLRSMNMKRDRLDCPHCSKNVPVNIYARYHGDRCKHKP